MPATASKPVILVVDDEPMIRMYAVDTFEEAGFNVFEAADGSEALAQLEAHPEISVLFTDIQMPGQLDGLALARKVHERRPEVRLLLASGNIRPRDEEIPDDGAFFPKPYDAADIAKKISEGVAGG